MTSFRIDEFPFDAAELTVRAPLDPRLRNWPVVYTLQGDKEIYVGESLNVTNRLFQHLKTKGQLSVARLVLDETFNKSVCLDLESFLIRLLAADEQFQVLNGNSGITDADYYGRSDYQATFDAVFEDLRQRGLFTRSVREIENSDLFKLSPFKALNPDQASAVEDILDGLFADIEAQRSSRIVIQGDPGTGKTVVAIFLMKLLRDIQAADPESMGGGDSILSEFFVEGYPELLQGFRFGLVVPQQSLRRSIQNVFRKTPGLDPSMVMTPFEIGQSTERFDLLLVDETHRLNQRSNQNSGMKNAQFRAINERLFGVDDVAFTQLDWVTQQSDHQIFLVDSAQRVRPHDVSPQALTDLIRHVDEQHRRYRLLDQMRVSAGSDYVGYVRSVLSDDPPRPRTFGEYDLRMYDDLGLMREAIRRRDAEHGLARMVAGFAWPWNSRRDDSASDIEIDGLELQWNRTDVDWVSSPTSLDEVGSIHTIQGYDLNYAAVIIGKDLKWDPSSGRLRFDRSHYFDKKGMENNPQLGVTYSDEDILEFVRNIYAVLLTRGIRGTYVYVCDPELRAHLRPFLAVDD